MCENVHIEEVKTYWNSRPCNIRHSPNKVGTRAYFDDYQANAEELVSVVPVAPFDLVYKPEGSVIVIC